MPATSGIADISIAGKARSYDTRLSLFRCSVGCQRKHPRQAGTEQSAGMTTH